jgi:hypothetical protein
MPGAGAHLRSIGGIALAAAGIFGVAGSAGASQSDAGNTGVIAPTGNSGSGVTPKSLSAIKSAAKTAIGRRLKALDDAMAEVESAVGLGSNQAVLVSYLKTDVAPLQSLEGKIQSDTSIKQASQDFASIFKNYRVYVLQLPAATVADEADRATVTSIPNLSKAASEAESLENASNQAELQPLIADLNTQISAAGSSTDGLATRVLAFTPAQWNANHNVLADSKSEARTSFTALQKGRSDVAQILTDLKHGIRSQLNPTGNGSTTGLQPGSSLRGGLRSLRGVTTTTP